MFFQLAAAGHATGANSHTLFWNQAEDKFKQVDGDLKGLPVLDLTTAKEEVTEIKSVLDIQVVWRKMEFKNDLKKVNISMTFIISSSYSRKLFYLQMKYM